MPERKKEQDRVGRGSNSNSFLVIFGTLGDTTWRMFVPTIGLLLVGNALDGKFGTKPWLMFAGIVVGGGIAAYLIRRQLKEKI